MSAARDRMHIKFCQNAHCYIEGEAGLACRNMDHLLDWAEEEVRHKVARELAGSPAVSNRTLGPGVCWAVTELDPYERVDAFDPEYDEIHPKEERPDCPKCVAGVEHWHRKDDGQPVQEGSDA